jgi:hypothetical protein
VALLVQELARRLPGDDGRVVAFTSGGLTDNVPVGCTKSVEFEVELSTGL